MKIVVSGSGMTKFGELWERSWESLVLESATEAMNEAGVKIEEIDMLVVGTLLLSKLEGKNHAGALAAEVLGFEGPAMMVEGACASGGLAVLQGMLALKSGMARKVLVVGAEKMTDVSGEQITRALMGAGSEEEFFSGATFPALYSLVHQAYIQEYRVSELDLAAVSVKNHAHGALNPLAHFRKEIQAEQVLTSAPVALPIRQLHCSPVSDGAAAVLLEVRDRVGNEVEVVGYGQGGDTLSLANRESLTAFKATREASRQAYQMARVGPEQIEVAEVHDCFSVAEVLAVEDLGFCQKGKGAEAIASGFGHLTQNSPSRVVVNTSGGLKACGHPVGATGVKQIVELYRQLKGVAGSRQVSGARWGLAQNVGGSGATAVVHILRGPNGS